MAATGFANVKGYSPFGRLVRSELSMMWIFSY
jgi:hypothetical protein